MLVEFVGLIGFIEFFELLGFIGFVELGVKVFDEAGVYFRYYVSLRVNFLECFIRYIILNKCNIEVTLHFNC